MTRKLKVVVASALVALLLIVILYTQVIQAPLETVKVCAILPITGVGSVTAIEVRDGVLLAVDEINSYGGINGRHIELIVLDCETDPVIAAEQFRTMETDKPPLFYVTATSPISSAVAPLAEAAEVPLIAVASTDTSLTNGTMWVFRYYFGTEQEVGVGLEFLIQFGVHRLGILASDDLFGISVSETLKRGFEAVGGEVQIERFRITETDFATRIQNVSANDAVYCVAELVQLKQVLVQLNRSGYVNPILTTSGAAAPYFSATSEVDGVYLAAPSIYSLVNHEAISFAGKFQEKYGRSFSSQAASGYDVLEMVAGLLHDQELSRERLLELLTGGFVYNGSLGILAVHAGEHNMAFGLFRARMESGKLVYI